MDYFTSRLVLSDYVLTKSGLGVPAVQKKPTSPQFLKFQSLSQIDQS